MFKKFYMTPLYKYVQYFTKLARKDTAKNHRILRKRKSFRVK